ncbi:hypothetical protein [Brevibacillus sp. SKDU10]|uniref:hypothetical protein n=1 Tax=Brevibacillus sp. SKDU10 TaxID=1247872 RepID=UPI000AECAFEB|nr:hypothetical protein [Brevibacillus sp. SKDU10]
MNEVTKDQIRESVRDNYKKVALSATDNSSCWAPGKNVDDYIASAVIKAIKS